MRRTRKSRFSKPFIPLDVELQCFYADFTSATLDLDWSRHTRMKQSAESIRADESILTMHNTDYIAQRAKLNCHFLKSDCSLCESNRDYADHLNVALFLEEHYQKETALHMCFPSLKRNRYSVSEILRRESTLIYSFQDKKFTWCKTILHIKCSVFGLNHNIAKSMLSVFAGMTYCVGYFVDKYSRCRDSEAFEFICRILTHDPSDENNMSSVMRLDDVTAKLVGNRLKLEDWGPHKGDVLRLRPVTTLVPTLRLFRAIHDMSAFLTRLSLSLNGAVIPQLPWLDHELVSFKEITPTLRNTEERTLRFGVYLGCLDYLDSLPPSLCDRYLKLGALKFLRQALGLDPGSSSISLTVGPPGIVKTQLRIMVIVALLHYSKAGHFKPGSNNPTVLPNKFSPTTTPLYCSDNPNAIRI